ncbi:MAG: PAS domain S-box protein [Promethearchaeota archaeon]
MNGFLKRKEYDYNNLLLELVNVILVIINRDGLIEYINKKGCEILGYAKDEVIGRNWFQTFIPGNEREKVENVFNGLIDGIHDNNYFENHILTKDGKEIIIAWHNRVVVDEKGRALVTISSGDDITEKKIKERKLEESESFLRFETEIDNLFLSDPGKVAYDKALDLIIEFMDCKHGLFGYINEEGDLICPTFTDGIWDECQMEKKKFLFPCSEFNHTIWGKAILERDVKISNSSFVMRGGNKPMQNCIASPIIHHGEVIGVLMVIGRKNNFGNDDSKKIKKISNFLAPILHAHLERDVDERKRKELELSLRMSEEKYRMLFNESKDAIFIVNAQGLILEVNQNASKLSGYTTSELCTMHLQQIQEPGNKELIAKMLNEILIKGENRFETMLKTKSNDIITVEINAKLLDKKRGLIQGILRDITERKRIEERLENFSRFPLENPNPIFRVNENGIITYANKGCDEIFKRLDCKGGGKIHDIWQGNIFSALSSNSIVKMEVMDHDIVYAFEIIPIKKFKYVNVYGHDITKRKEYEIEIHRKSEIERLIAKISSLLIIGTLETFQDIISDVLKLVGNFFSSDRIVILLLDEYGKFMSFYAEWSKERNDDNFNTRKIVNTERIPWLVKKIESGEIYEIMDIRELPMREKSELLEISPGNLYTKKFLPLIFGTKTIGVLEFDFQQPSEAWNKEIKDVGKTISQIIASSISNIESSIALLNSKTRYKDLIESLNDAFMIDDENFKITYVNEKFCQLLGFEKREVIGKTLFEMVDEEMLDLFKEQMDARKNGISGNYELTFRKKDGNLLYALVSAKPISDLTGIYGGSFAVITDITELKKLGKNLEYQLQLENIISQVSTDFINKPIEDIDRSINNVLKMIGLFIGYTHAILGLFYENYSKMEVINEWSMNGKDFIFLNRNNSLGKNYTFGVNIEWLIDILDGKDYVQLEGHEKIKEILKDANFFSILIIPIKIKKKLIGFVGFGAESLMGEIKKEITILSRFVSEVISNVLEKKEIEGKLRDSEQRYRLITENANDLIGVISKDFICEFQNDTYSKILGYGANEWVGRDYRQLIHRDDVPIFLENIDRQIHDNIEKVTFEIRMINKLQIYFWFEVSSKIIKSEEQDKFLIVSREITVRKIVEDRLRESEARYRIIVENASELVAIVDEEYRFVYLNDKHAELLGYDLEDLYNRNLMDIIHPDDIPSYDSLAARGELRILKSDGNYIWFEVKGTPFKDKDGMEKTIFISRDISSSKEFKEKLIRLNEDLERRVIERTRDLERAQEKMLRQEKLAVLGKLSGSVSHELRNPLGIISNSIFYLKRKFSQEGEKVKRHLQIIESEIKRSKKIINDLLDASRIGKTELSDGNLNEIVNNAINRVEKPLNVKVDLSLDTEIPNIKIDGEQLVQAIQNIIINAYEAMPDGGSLTISTKLENNMISIYIKDTGIGIEKDKLNLIFEPLFTTKRKGIGLGLTIVSDIIEKHGGSIFVDSEVSVGTMFSIRIPLH